MSNTLKIWKNEMPWITRLPLSQFGTDLGLGIQFNVKQVCLVPSSFASGSWRCAVPIMPFCFVMIGFLILRDLKPGGMSLLYFQLAHLTLPILRITAQSVQKGRAVAPSAVRYHQAVADMEASTQGWQFAVHLISMISCASPLHSVICWGVKLM